MAAKSDIRSPTKRRTRRVSATWASRNFRELLDKVEKGERFELVRRGKVIGMFLDPAGETPDPDDVPGRKISEILAMMGANASLAPDAEFGKDVLEGIQTAITEDPPSWD